MGLESAVFELGTTCFGDEPDLLPVSRGVRRAVVPARAGFVPRPALTAPWAPSRTSGAWGRPGAALPHLEESRRDELPLPAELAQRFRALCALGDADPARVLEGLVRSYVIMKLAGGTR